VFFRVNNYFDDMFRYLMLCSLACVCFHAYGQQALGVLYKDMVFSKVKLSKNISYLGEHKTHRKKKYYTLDFYRAQGDTAKYRPLIIWIHGGGFKFGTKRSKGTPLWAKTFARSGYVCAAINYRLSRRNTLFNFTDLVAACYEAVEDTRLAISFLKKEYRRFGIDTNTIILAGNSAGGMVAIHSVYASSKELGTLAGRADSATLSTVHNPDKIDGIINFWGAVFDTSWLSNAKIPIVSAHGTGDRVVAFSQRLAPLFGSYYIHRRANALGIPNSLKAYEGYGHELQKHFNPVLTGAAVKRRWKAIGRFAREFLYQNVLKHRHTTGI
jgi:acetyl esterase/lipase